MTAEMSKGKNYERKKKTEKEWTCQARKSNDAKRERKKKVRKKCN